MSSAKLASWAIASCKAVLASVLNWFIQIYDAVGLTSLWIGAVVFVAVFSIVVVPLRGGADLSRGALGSFLMNKVNRHKGQDE